MSPPHTTPLLLHLMRSHINEWIGWSSSPLPSSRPWLINFGAIYPLLPLFSVFIQQAYFHIFLIFIRVILFLLLCLFYLCGLNITFFIVFSMFHLVTIEWTMYFYHAILHAYWLWTSYAISFIQRTKCHALRIIRPNRDCVVITFPHALQPYWQPHNRAVARRIQNMGWRADGGLWLLARGGGLFLSKGIGVREATIKM